MKWTFRLALVTALMSLAAFGFAQGAPSSPMDRPQHVLKSLGLTDDQITQVTDVFTKHQATARAERAQVRVYQAQIDLGLTADTPDVKAIDDLVDKKASVQAQIQKDAVATDLQIKKIVGDKVFYELKVMMQNHRRMGWRSGEPGQGGPQGDQGPNDGPRPMR